MDTKNDIDIRIVDFLTGSTDAETIRALEEWVRSSRENRDYFFSQCECWIAAIDADSAARYDAEKAFEQFKLRTGIHGRSRRLSPWVPWVAAAAITVIASVFAFLTGKKAVQAIVLDQSMLNLNYKDTFKIGAEIYPADAANTVVYWTSSNEKAVTVDTNGTVHAVGRGTALVTCSSADGFASAECQVRVDYTLRQWVTMVLLFGWLWY